MRLGQIEPTNLSSYGRQRTGEICVENNIALVYLFGSQQENGLKLLDGQKMNLTDHLTDIDVGLVFSFDLETIPHRHKLYARIFNSLEELFRPYQLDLVFLQENHSVFQTEALKGICIYTSSEEFRDDYEMAILRRAADFKYVLDKYTEEVLEKY
jgi:uncharacterized protein